MADLPRMIIMAGAPGSGKSTAFPAGSFGVAHFNADDRAAALNGGSYLAIPPEVRQQVNRDFEQFIFERIRLRESFAIETTLRGSITFTQAALARTAGFRCEMRYLGLEHFALHRDRVRMRAYQGGHSASEGTLRRIHEASYRNIGRAVREMDFLSIYDNSRWGATPRLLMQSEAGVVVYAAAVTPPWLADALRDSL